MMKMNRLCISRHWTHLHFLKKQMNTGYFENLIREYLLDNKHGVIVTLKPERGRTARMDKELHDEACRHIRQVSAKKRLQN